MLNGKSELVVFFSVVYREITGVPHYRDVVYKGFFPTILKKNTSECSLQSDELTNKNSIYFKLEVTKRK